jgi:hypothetical protein
MLPVKQVVSRPAKHNLLGRGGGSSLSCYQEEDSSVERYTSNPSEGEE